VDMYTCQKALQGGTVERDQQKFSDSRRRSATATVERSSWDFEEDTRECPHRSRDRSFWEEIEEIVEKKEGMARPSGVLISLASPSDGDLGLAPCSPQDPEDQASVVASCISGANEAHHIRCRRF
jgi:hypothetical protein